MVVHEIRFLRLWVRVRKGLRMLTLVGFGVFMVCALVYKTPCEIHAQDSLDISKRIPVETMAFVSPERDWIICHYAGLRFSVPPSLANNVVTKSGTPFVEFSDGTNRVQVSGAFATLTSVRESRASLKGSMPPQLRNLSHIKLKVVAYQGSKDPATQEWLERMGLWFRLGAGIKAEYIEKEQWEGLLNYRRNGFYTLDWETKDETACGIIGFKVSSSDINWVRALCHSLTIENQPVSLEELRASPEGFLRMERREPRVVE